MVAGALKRSIGAILKKRQVPNLFLMPELGLSSSLLWLRVAAACYAVGMLHVLLLTLRRQSPLGDAAVTALKAGLLFHVVSLAERSMLQGASPTNSFTQTISLCGLVVAGLFLLIRWRYRFQELGVAMFPVAFLMTLAGTAEGAGGMAGASSAGRGFWLWLHIVLALFGYAALLLTSVASAFYLLQERRLKLKRHTAFLQRISLATLDDMISRSMSWGFVFVTLALLAGGVWGFGESGTRWLMRPEVTISFVLWGFCLLMVFLRVSAGWRGRRTAILSLVALGGSAVTWAAHIGIKGLFTQ